MRAAAAEKYNAGNGFGERLYALRAQRLHALVGFRHFGLCDAHRLAESGDLRHRLGAGAHAFLLPAAENVRRELQPLPDVQRADALGRMDLVSAHGYHVRAERFGGERLFQKALHRVGMEKRAGFRGAQRAGHARNVRHGAGLVVDHHKRYERRILAKRVAHRVDGDRAGAVGGEERYLPALARELFERLAHGVVLHGGGDDVPSDPPPEIRALQNRPVVALRTAGGEVHFLCGASERGGELIAGIIEHGARLASRFVRRAGVAVQFRHHLICRVRRLRAYAGRRGIIEIDFHIHTSF